MGVVGWATQLRMIAWMHAKMEEAVCGSCVAPGIRHVTIAAPGVPRSSRVRGRWHAPLRSET